MALATQAEIGGAYASVGEAAEIFDHPIDPGVLVVAVNFYQRDHAANFGPEDTDHFDDEEWDRAHLTLEIAPRGQAAWRVASRAARRLLRGMAVTLPCGHQLDEYNYRVPLGESCRIEPWGDGADEQQVVWTLDLRRLQ